MVLLSFHEKLLKTMEKSSENVYGPDKIWWGGNLTVDHLQFLRWFLVDYAIYLHLGEEKMYNILSQYSEID